MAVPAVTTSFAEHLAPGLREIVGTNLEGAEAFYSKFYNVETSSRNYEEYLAGAGLPIATEKPEGEAVVAYDALEGSTKRFTHKAYAIGFEVSKEMNEDDLYAGAGSAVRDAADGLSDSMLERVEIEAHRPFNAEGFDGSTFLVLPDSSGLFATSHAPVAGGEAAAQANRPSTEVDLNITSFRAALITFRNQVNDRGLRIPGFSTPQKLIVGVDQEFSAQEVVNNMTRPDSANDIQNFSKGRVSIEVTPYMTAQSDSWIIQGSRHKMNFLWRRRPDFDAFDDRRATVAIFMSTMRFVVAPVSWRGMYGSTGI